MKKKYSILIGLFFLTVILLLMLSIFLRVPLINFLLNLVYAIPISIGTTFLINALIWGPKAKRYSDVKTPMGTSKEFLQAQPYICDNCGNFMSMFREICENCEAKNSLRRATQLDYNKHLLNKYS